MTGTFRALRWCLIASVVLITACGAGSASDDDDDSEGGGDGSARGGIHVEKHCNETFGDICSQQCSECWSVCAGAISSGVNCTGTCESICDCSDASPNVCTSWSYQFDLGTPHPDNVDACVALLTELDTRCFPDRPADARARTAACSQWVRAENQAAPAYYACVTQNVAAGECEGPAEECAPEPGTLGTTLCKTAIAQCKVCSIDAEAVDGIAALLRDDFSAAASSCFKLDSCFDKLDCLEAWQAIAFGY